jgi:hypothetical protein
MNYPLVIKHSLLENPSFSSMIFLSTDARVSSGRPSQTCLITVGYSTQCESPRTGEGRGYAFITFKKLEEARKFVGYRPLVVVVAWQDGEYLTEENRVLSHLMFSFAVITSMNTPNHIPKYSRYSSAFAVNCHSSVIIVLFCLASFCRLWYYIKSHHISMFEDFVPCFAGQLPTSPWLNNKKLPSMHSLAATVATARRKKPLRQMGTDGIGICSVQFFGHR